MNCCLANRFSGLAHYAPKTQAQTQTYQSVFAFRKFLKRFFDNSRFWFVWLNISSFRVINITEWRKRWPFSAPDVFRKVVAVIFALSKSYLKHKQTLRSWLKPECRKAQRSYF